MIGKLRRGVFVMKKGSEINQRAFVVAEREGFEPPEVLPSTVFKTAAIDHSAISPKICLLLGSSCGVTEIRTRDTLLAYTRFPGVPLQPLEHHSKKKLQSLNLRLRLQN